MTNPAMKTDKTPMTIALWYFAIPLLASACGYGPT
jgi:hypothetical protein